MKSIFRAFDCPAGIMVGDTKRDQKNFWNTSFLLMIVPNFPSSIAVKKSEGHFIVKFESDDTQFTFTDMESAGLESFYDFVFARWKEKLANYFHASSDVVARETMVSISSPHCLTLSLPPSAVSVSSIQQMA